jgi:hypothetical protein
MEQEESEKAICLLFNTIEGLLAEVTAYRLALALVSEDKDPMDCEALEFFVKKNKEEILNKGADSFVWLRDTLLSSVSDTHPQPPLLPEWEEELRRLVESAGNIDPSEER